jgi:hypothetical protein
MPVTNGRSYQWTNYDRGFEIVAVKTSIFCNIIANQSTCLLHLESRGQAKHVLLARLFHSCFLHGLFFDPEDGSIIFLTEVMSLKS